MDRLYLSTVETLAMAIDAKDDVTHSHVRRVQAYATGLARVLGITDEKTLKAIEAAALLHDTGKLAVPEHILNKPGKLTDAEFEKMKRHVDVGADILALVQFPFPVEQIVRCHHENWDGSGYPRGVAGEAIPIGARILSVVDCFDALTSDRPYRARMADEDALDILRERRGRMYDPHVVDTFIRVYRQIQVAHTDTSEQRKVMQSIGQSRPEVESPPVASAATIAPGPGNLLAFVSLSRLASGEGNLDDVLALSSKLIAEVIPGQAARGTAGKRPRLPGRHRDVWPRVSGDARGVGRSRGAPDRMGGGEPLADSEFRCRARPRRARTNGHAGAAQLHERADHRRLGAGRRAQPVCRHRRCLHRGSAAAGADGGAASWRRDSGGARRGVRARTAGREGARAPSGVDAMRWNPGVSFEGNR